MPLFVFHTAAKAGIWGAYKEYYKTNYIGTKNISDICFKKKIPLIYTSSPSVIFDGKDMKGADENVPYPAKFASNYSKTKAIAEQYVLKLGKKGLENIILRPHLIWGPDDNHLIPRILKKSKRLARIGNKRNLIDTIYIDNASYAHILAAKKLLKNKNLSNKIYFVSQNEPIYIWDMIDEILKTHGIDKIKKRVPYFLAYFIACFFEAIYLILRIKKEPPITRFVVKELSHSHFFNTNAIQKDLGFFPTISIKEGLKKIAQKHLNN